MSHSAADHLISDDKSFEKAIGKRLTKTAGNLVVFGVRPSGPETGYGYLEVAKACHSTQP